MADAGKGRGQGGDFIHDFAGRIVVHGIAHGGCEARHRFPFAEPGLFLEGRADAIDAALGIGERAVLFEEGGAGQEDVGKGGGLVEEQVLHDDAVHCRQCCLDVLGVGVGLGDVFALNEQAPVAAIEGGIKHVGDAEPWLGIERDAPGGIEAAAHGAIRHMAIARQFVRERAHVAGALHIVLPAQRIDADAFAADIAGRHGKVGHGHHHGRALRMLGDPEAVIDRAVPGLTVEAGGAADQFGLDADDGRLGFGRMFGLGDKGTPALEFHRGAALGDERLVDKALGDDDMGNGVHQRHVGAGAQRQVIGRLDVGRTDEIDAARIGDDQLRAGAQPLLHARGKDRVSVGGVGADQQDHVGLFDRGKILGAGRGAEGLLQAVAGGRMADAGAGVDVVVAEGGADHFLDDVDFFIGAARRTDAADGATAVFGLDRLEPVGGKADRLVPGDDAPRIGDLVADHRGRDTVVMGGVAEGEAPLDAGMPGIGAAILGRDHADQFVALEFGGERATDAAIGAGGVDGAGRHTVNDDGFFLERCGRAGGHAGAAGDAFGGEEIIRQHAGGNLGAEALPGNGQRQGALHFVAGPDTARTDDAFGRIELEIGVRDVDLVAAFGGEVIFSALGVAHVAQADLAGGILQLAVAIGAAGQAIEWMIGDIEFHDALAQLFEPRRLGRNLHAGTHRGGARGGGAFDTFDFDQAKPAGAEGLKTVGGAKLWDRAVEHGRGAHHRGALGDSDRNAVDLERDHLGRCLGRGAVVDFLQHYLAPSPLVFGAKSVPNSRIADLTGIGVNPPMAQSDPWVITSQRSSTRARLVATLRPAMISATVSLPRTEPIRHGVHFPQLSCSQNSNARRAISAMSTVSSNTTMPPCPSMASFSARLS